MKKFEYFTVRLSALGPSGETFSPFVDMLKDLGAQGWELCVIDYGCAFLKREQSVEEEQSFEEITTLELARALVDDPVWTRSDINRAEAVQRIAGTLIAKLTRDR